MSHTESPEVGPGAAASVCADCDIVGPTEFFVSTKSGSWCEACIGKKKKKGTSPILWIYLVLAFGFISYSGGWQAVLGTFFLAVPFLLLSFPLVAVHEAGHAVVGRLLGAPIAHVRLGIGPRLFKFDLGETRVDVRLLPISGATHFVVGSTSPYRPAIVLAGVGATLLMLPPLVMWQPDSQIVDTLVRGVAINLIIISGIINLLPVRRSNGAWVPLATDGGMLYRWFTGQTDSAAVCDADTQARLGTLVSRVEGGDVREAVERTRQDAERLPGDPAAQLLHGTALCFVADWRNAHRTLRPVAEAFENETTLKILALSNAAWAAVMCFDPELLPDADELSARAEAVRPTLAAVSSVRGSVLVMLGRREEGRRLLDRAAGLTVKSTDLATIHGMRAIAAATDRDALAAREAFDLMLNLDPSCPVRPYATRSVAQLETGISSPLPPPRRFVTAI